MMTFRGKTVVVVGGASGIGLATAAMLSGLGAKLLVADRNLDAAVYAAKELGGHPLSLDIGDEDSVTRAEEQVRREHGPVGALINCAGILQRTLPPAQLTMEEWDRVLRIDLRGTYLSCRAFGCAMQQAGGGAIVNVASVAGMVSGPLHGYGPAKAGVIHLTQCLAAEFGRDGVRVNTVSPGFTMTPALGRGIQHEVMNVSEMTQAAAMNRLLKPEEIAAAICFLASDLASGITGANLPVDGGYLVATPWASYGGLRDAVGQPPR